MLNQLRQCIQHFISSHQPKSDHAQGRKNIHLSIVTQFYPPDFAATGQFVDELAQQLSKQMQVQVFTGQPGYAFTTEHAPREEMMGQVKVMRSKLLRFHSRKFSGRTISSLAFCWHAALHLLNCNHRGDLILLTSEPPFLPVLGYLLKQLFHSPYACLVYDLYPEVAVELGVVAKTHWLVAFWNRVNRSVWRSAEVIIVPCQTMKDRMVAKVPEVAHKITVIHNWADPEWIKPLKKSDNPFAQNHALIKPFTVLYSGNMGRCHDMETVLGAAQELRHESVQFVFIGGGPKRQECEERIAELGLTNCLFLPYQDKALLPQSLTACDLSLVSVDVGMEGLVAPSKFYSALASGRPVAVICEKHSYLRSLVADANCGAAFSNGDSKGLAGFIRYLLKDSDVGERMGLAGYRYLRDYFTPGAIANQYYKLLQRAVVKHADLYQAVDRSEFEVCYQPVLSLRTGQLKGFETLIRWNHPDRGLLCPADFLAAAEETNLIIPLGWWLLDEVGRQLSKWRSQFPHQSLQIGINLSSQQFFHADLIPTVDEVLCRYSLDGNSLMLEVKDSTIMEDAAATTAIVLQLQNRQIQVCIDDFGGNHTSLEYLHRFPVNALKVDRTLTNRISTERTTAQLIETVLILAKDLGMEAIASGIETPEQLRRIKEMGFSSAQGYLFSAPEPASQIEHRLCQLSHSILMHYSCPLPIPSHSLTNTDAPLVLVIDDDRSMRAILKGAISKAGYRFAEASNGEDGIKACHQLRPNLILLDAVMPDMDGFTCCKQLQIVLKESYNRNPQRPEGNAIVFQKTPIVMITALDDPESVDQAFAAGAIDYITKPINWAVLKQRLRQVLG